MKTRIIVGALSALLVAGSAEAQRGRGRALEAGGPPPGGELPRQIRQAFMGRVKTELKLSDEQLRKLQDTDRKFQQQRSQLTRDERASREALRIALEDSTKAPDPAKVEAYLNQLVKGQHQRADLLEGEQKELAAFLDPVQRAKFFALRDQLNRKIAELQGQRGGARRGGPPPPID